MREINPLQVPSQRLPPEAIMTPDPQSSPPSPRPLATRLSEMTGCFFGVVAAAFFTLYVFAGCTDAPESNGSVAVHDAADLLSPGGRERLALARFPAGIPVVVRTVDSIPAQRIGSFATDLMDEEPAWQTLRPRGLL